MNGLTQFEYEHSTSSELLGLRVNLTFRWISHFIASCPRAGFTGFALPSGVQGLAEPNSCVSWEMEMAMTLTCLMVLLVVMGACFLLNHAFIIHEGVRCLTDYRVPSPECRHSSRSRARWIGHRRWRSPRRNHPPGTWLFHFLAQDQGENKTCLPFEWLI